MRIKCRERTMHTFINSMEEQHNKCMIFSEVFKNAAFLCKRGDSLASTQARNRFQPKEIGLEEGHFHTKFITSAVLFFHREYQGTERYSSSQATHEGKLALATSTKG